MICRDCFAHGGKNVPADWKREEQNSLPEFICDHHARVYPSFQRLGNKAGTWNSGGVPIVWTALGSAPVNVPASQPVAKSPHVCEGCRHPNIVFRRENTSTYVTCFFCDPCARTQPSFQRLNYKPGAMNQYIWSYLLSSGVSAAPVPVAKPVKPPPVVKVPIAESFPDIAKRLREIQAAKEQRFYVGTQVNAWGNKLGEYSTTWLRIYWKPYKGQVTLSNEGS